jgi:hypothetical protein
MMEAKVTARTPLKDKPLRQAGQSLREERERILEDKFVPWLFGALMTIAFAGYEWFRFKTQLPYSPWALTVLAAVATGIAVWRFFVLRPKMRNLKLGLQGEIVVGQYLDRLHADGYQVFHDVQGQNFNLDHVLIGPAGVFTVETKTWNKPHGDAKVTFDGERLLVAGKAPERDPVVQARAQASWLRAQFRESTGKDFDVRSVIVFPGWFVEANYTAQRKLWVLEPKALPTFLSNEPSSLNAEERKLASFHLSRMIRGAEQDR